MVLAQLATASLSILLAQASLFDSCRIGDVLSSVGLAVETCAQQAERQQREADRAQYLRENPPPPPFPTRPRTIRATGTCGELLVTAGKSSSLYSFDAEGNVTSIEPVANADARQVARLPNGWAAYKDVPETDFVLLNPGTDRELALPKPDDVGMMGSGLATSGNTLFVGARLAQYESYAQDSDLLLAYEILEDGTVASEPYWRGAGALAEGFGRRVTFLDVDGDGTHDHFTSPDWGFEEREFVTRLFRFDSNTKSITEVEGGLVHPPFSSSKVAGVATSWDYDGEPGDELVMILRHPTNPNNNPTKLAVFKIDPETGQLDPTPLYASQPMANWPRATAADVDCDGVRELVVTTDQRGGKLVTRQPAATSADAATLSSRAPQ